VVINHVSENSGQKAQALLDELHEQYGTEGIIVRGDVQDYEACREIISQAIDRFGKIAVLVNNAGIQFGKKYAECTKDDYVNLINVNLLSAMHCCHLVLPHMIREKYGCIINVGSTGGLKGNEGQVPYNAAKAGMLGLTRGLATEYAKDNITVNYLAPGLTDTDILTGGHGGKMMHGMATKVLSSRVPLGRLGTADEMGEAISFMAKARYMTGQVIALNGGAFHH